MRVLIDYRPALRERSGSGEYTHQLVKALLASDAAAGRPRALELTLFSSSWKDRLAPSSDLAGAAIVDRRVPVRLLNLAWHRLGWPPAETLAGGAFDVVHSPHPLLLPARAAAQVITIHDLDFLTHPERTRAEIRRDYPALAGEHARRADAVLVPSAYTAGEVERRLGVPRDRIAICPPGAPDWTPRTVAPKDGYVLFFSTLEPRKNVGGLLDAYERLIASARDGLQAVPGLPDLVLAGRATNDAQPWLDRISRPPLQGVVRHIGYVDAYDRRALYEGARMLVQPSFEEGFGMPVLEAMSLGVPVVAANRGSLPEVLGGAGLLVDPNRPDDIAQAIARLMSDDGLAAECAAKGIARAGAFRWDETAHRVYETYQLAIERRAARRG
ncbi:MAG TPA: glycosyltransferase family 1 protein [Vicinamibacterales bacterium]|nr:glycosyltransferase family 1 protein [Vicinamibacterales bacterium]